MKIFIQLLSALCLCFTGFAQTFVRSELNTNLNSPWEIVYGPDQMLWLTEANGAVTRVNPTTGASETVYIAPDYFSGSDSEKLNACFNPGIGSGTLGLALHPDFMEAGNSYLYFVYSYNHGTENNPDTRFRIKRLTWDKTTESVVADSNVVNGIHSGHDHLGGRLLALNQNGNYYLYLSIGDHGISETNSPDCYTPQSTNPNNETQNPLTDNGKIHRFNIDGSLPSNNPTPNSSVFTRGHRNPQGLMYNPRLNLVYDVEHGDRTDDEINILKSGKNYGWKHARGYHDGLHPGENDFVANYTPNPMVANDGLEEAFYSWCDSVAPDPEAGFTDWCTVAPSGGDYYGSTTIPEWENSLLVVTLKKGTYTDRQLFQLKLLPDGSKAPSTNENPNPKKFFASDQNENGRLRDLAISSDGSKIFLINNGGTDRDKITVYTYDNTSNIHANKNHDVNIYPNPSRHTISIKGANPERSIIAIQDQTGKLLFQGRMKNDLDISYLKSGIYFLTLEINGAFSHHKLIKR